MCNVYSDAKRLKKPKQKKRRWTDRDMVEFSKYAMCDQECTHEESLRNWEKGLL